MEKIVLFWTNKWRTETFDTPYPRLSSFVKDNLCSVQQALSISDMEEDFHLPLSAEALLELKALQLDLHGYSLSPSANDS
jgi:hypothetical protein